jgi:hypothetical protein
LVFSFGLLVFCFEVLPFSPLLYLLEKIYHIINFENYNIEEEQQDVGYEYIKYGGLLYSLTYLIISEKLSVSKECKGLDAAFFSRVYVVSKIFTMGYGNKKKKMYLKIVAILAGVLCFIDGIIFAGYAGVTYDDILLYLFADVGRRGRSFP